MSKVVDMGGKPHTGEGGPNFLEWAKLVDGHMHEVNLLFDELIRAHNRVADRVLELERKRRKPRGRIRKIWRGFEEFMLGIEEHIP